MQFSLAQLFTALPQFNLEYKNHLECNNTPVENIEVIVESTSLKSFTGNFKQFYTLKKLMHQDVDFSKIIGDMTTEEENIWYCNFYS